MLILAQIPGADEAIKKAAEAGGWEPVALVVIVFLIVTAFGYMLKRSTDDGKQREERLATRVTKLEDEIRVELFSQIKTTTTIMQEMTTAANRLSGICDRLMTQWQEVDQRISLRPCLLGCISQGRFQAEFNDLIRRHMKEDTDSIG